MHYQQTLSQQNAPPDNLRPRVGKQVRVDKPEFETKNGTRSVSLPRPTQSHAVSSTSTPTPSTVSSRQRARSTGPSQRAQPGRIPLINNVPRGGPAKYGTRAISRDEGPGGIPNKVSQQRGTGSRIPAQEPKMSYEDQLEREMREDIDTLGFCDIDDTCSYGSYDD